MKDTIKTPESIEELISRLEEAEAQINKYNEQILLTLNNELEESDETIDEEAMEKLFEEYNFLRELSESWRVKIDKNENEKTDVEETKKFIDYINPWFYLIAPIFCIAAHTFFQKAIGTLFLDMLAGMENIVTFFDEREEWQFKLVLNLLFLIYPLILSGLTFAFRPLLVRNKQMKLVYNIFQIVFGVLLIAMWIYTFITFINI